MVEKIFDIHDYSEKKKVKLIVVEFSGYAFAWWRKLCKSRKENEERPISSLVLLKRVMRNKIFSKRDLF